MEQESSIPQKGKIIIKSGSDPSKQKLEITEPLKLEISETKKKEDKVEIDAVNDFDISQLPINTSVTDVAVAVAGSVDY